MFIEETVNPTVHDRTFSDTLARHGQQLKRLKPEIFQLNVGKLCNLTCVHCHVNAGPRRKEIITKATLERILDWLATAEIPVVDLTGGAPEMIPDFAWFIDRLSEMPHVTRIIDRCNLTILLEPGFDWLADFLKQHRVEIVASMPCYQPDNVNAQRGEGVFDGSIKALQLLNSLGYGRHPELPLNLVYNPNGDFLPPEEKALEADYKRELRKHFGIEFHRLYALANLPVARFASYLKRNNRYDDYLQLLRDAFNPATVDGLMCRNTLSVSWQGKVFDCDFNQMLDIPLAGSQKKLIWDIDPNTLEGLPIATGEHCFGCTAGAGSSCSGALS